MIDGVCAMFGDLVSCAKKETQDKFWSIPASRLGNWQPGTAATKELEQLVSSKLQQSKAQSVISNKEVRAPEAVREVEQEFD